MAYTNFSTPTYYNNGSVTTSTCIGYESKHNRVVRFSFKTGVNGAKKISFNIKAGTISFVKGDVSDLTKIPFYVTTSATSHTNANYGQGSAVHGYITGSDDNAYSGSANITLKANTTYYVYFFPLQAKYGYSYWHYNSTYTTSYETTDIAKRTLTISVDTGSTITVNRTTSPVGYATGNLSNGSSIYDGDILKITFAPKTNYKLLTNTVNNTTFTSGNTHTVSGNVTAKATSQVLASSISASDANVEAVSTIKVTRYSTSYYHSIKFVYGSLSGYINRDGSISSKEEKFTDETINFTLPTSFYREMPRNATATCTLTCYTYANSTSTTLLGNATTCNFTVTVSREKSSPEIEECLITSDNTTYLTGDNTILVKHLSDVAISVTAKSKNDSFIEKITINNDVFNNVNTAHVSYSKITTDEFNITAIDTRGYDVKMTPAVEMIPYLPLTLNATITRKPPSGEGTNSEIMVSFNGNYFNGSFGKVDNSLRVDFCYKQKSDATFPDEWVTISSSDYMVGADKFYTNIEISLGENYDYQVIYDFKIRVTDATGESYAVVQDIQTLPVIPVFDWGEKDFNFNVPVSYATQPLFYTTGDTVSVDYARACFAGYLTENATQIYFTIPLNRPALANGVTIDGMVTPRGINGYVTAATWSDEAAHIDLKGMDNNYSVETQLNDIGIAVIITFVNKITSTPNNTPIILTPRYLTTITFT